MAWANQWTHRVNGVEFNDPANGITCVVPEVDNAPPVELVMVPVAQNFPVHHRSQPISAVLTFLVHVVPSGDLEADYARVQTMKAACAVGTPVMYQVQVRGMPDLMEVEVIFDSVMLDEFHIGKWTATATAPDPTLLTA